MGFRNQQALADAIGTDRARVSDWERGAHEPKGELRITLLRILKTSEAQIFGMDVIPPRPKSVSDMSPDDFAEAVAKKLAKPEPKGDRAELHSLVDLIPTTDLDYWLGQLRIAVGIKARSNKPNNPGSTGSR